MPDLILENISGVIRLYSQNAITADQAVGRIRAAVAGDPDNAGHWDMINGLYTNYACSKCNAEVVIKTPFCPWCGTAMAIYERR